MSRPDMDAKYARNRKEWFKNHGPCVDCGSTENLELDHVDPLQKESHTVWLWEKTRREKELAKCVARCHTCHVKRHRELRRLTIQRPPVPLTHPQMKHGIGRYHAGCRCDVCLDAKMIIKRRQYNKRKQLRLSGGNSGQSGSGSKSSS